MQKENFIREKHNDNQNSLEVYKTALKKLFKEM